MQHLSINNKPYHYPDRWADVTLEQAMRAAAIDLPSEVEDAFGWYEHLGTVRQVTAAMTDIPEALLEQVNPDQLVYMFAAWLLPLMKDLNTGIPRTFEPQLVESFTHKNVTYYLPDNLPIAGDVVLAHGQTVKPFVEASNLLAQFSKMRREGIHTMPLFVASVVKESPNEQWDEARIAKRAEALRDLRMDFFFTAWHSISVAIVRQMTATLQSIVDETPVREKPQTFKHWLAMRRGRYQLQRRELREIWKQLTK